jgi:hypothetical protein
VWATVQGATQLPADSVRRVVHAVFTRPEYQWVERRQPLQWLFDAIGRLLDWLGALSKNHPVGSTVLTWVAIVLLAAILAHVGYVAWRIVQYSPRSDSQPGTVAQIYDADQHLALAERLAREGRYSEALAHRFLAVLLQLDRAAALRFHASKTPAEYLGELKLDAAGRESFGTLVGRLYRHLFGALPCGEADYREFSEVAQRLTRERHVVPA